MKRSSRSTSHAMTRSDNKSYKYWKLALGFSLVKKFQLLAWGQQAA